MKVKPNTTAEHVALRHGVPVDAEFQRIERLPRRIWTKRQMRAVAKRLTAQLKRPHGEQELWPDQAVALREIELYGGISGGLRVSGGKSLVSFLAATMMPELERPLLICPTKSIKTGKILTTYREAQHHWKVRDDYTWLSYDLLQREEYAEYLFNYRPGIVILDEAHHAGRYRSSRSQRLERYKAANPDVPIIVLTGSLVASRVVDDSLRLLSWSRGDASPLPLPRKKQTVRFWKMALEVPQRTKPGALRRLCKDGETALQGVGRRYVETPGVVCSRGKNVVASALVCNVASVELESKQLIEAFDYIRTGKLPDGTELLDPDGSNLWKTAQTLALGFYYVYDPSPPTEWLSAYRNWCAFVREYTSDESNRCDTAKQVAKAVANDPDAWPYHDWTKVKHLYKLQRRAVWLSDERVHRAKRWMKAHKHGLVWVPFKAFGERLSPYYGSQARDRETGCYIVDHKPGTAAAASIRVCSEDLNLQYQFHQNYFPAPPATGAYHEQAIARTHRFGQPAEEVTVDYEVACSENVDALRVARQREKAAATLTQDYSRKLLIADWYEPKTQHSKHPQWKGKKQRKAVMI